MYRYLHRIVALSFAFTLLPMPAGLGRRAHQISASARMSAEAITPPGIVAFVPGSGQDGITSHNSVMQGGAAAARMARVVEPASQPLAETQRRWENLIAKAKTCNDQDTFNALLNEKADLDKIWADRPGWHADFQKLKGRAENVLSLIPELIQQAPVIEVISDFETISRNGTALRDLAPKLESFADRPKFMNALERLAKEEENLRSACARLAEFPSNPTLHSLFEEAESEARSAHTALGEARAALTRAEFRITSAEQERDLQGLIQPWTDLTQKISALTAWTDQWDWIALGREARNLRERQASSPLVSAPLLLSAQRTYKEAVLLSQRLIEAHEVATFQAWLQDPESFGPLAILGGLRDNLRAWQTFLQPCKFGPTVISAFRVAARTGTPKSTIYVMMSWLKTSMKYRADHHRVISNLADEDNALANALRAKLGRAS